MSATGAVAALADTLFPSASLAEGFVEDFEATSTALTRLRIVHPILAVAVGMFVVWIALGGRASGVRRPRAARVLVWLVGLQLAAGIVNVILLTPIWMQLVHLLVADLLWIALIWFGLEALSETSETSGDLGRVSLSPGSD